MSWFLWLLAAYFAANLLGSIALVGKRREPITPGGAVVLVILYAGIIVGILSTGGVL